MALTRRVELRHGPAVPGRLSQLDRLEDDIVGAVPMPLFEGPQHHFDGSSGTAGRTDRTPDRYVRQAYESSRGRYGLAAYSPGVRKGAGCTPFYYHGKVPTARRIYTVMHARSRDPAL